MKIVLWLMILVTFAACQKGGFDENHDDFRSIYGLAKPNERSQQTTFVGRVLSQSGQPVVGARIYTQGNPTYALSNEMGGFILRNLPAESLVLYILGPGYEGATLDLDLSGKTGLITHDGTYLKGMMQLTGLVHSGDAPVPEARISLLDSPFSTLTDESGHYALIVPSGTYQLRVKQAAYELESQPDFVITGDREVDFDLRPAAYPDAELILLSDTSYIRGLQAHFEVIRTPGVKFYRFLSFSELLADNPQADGKWHQIGDELIVAAKSSGVASFSVEFMDEVGKVTDELSYSYAYADYDDSWTIVSGNSDSDVVIAAGKKVVFVPTHLGVASAKASSLNPGNDRGLQVANSDSNSAPKSSGSIMVSPVINGRLLIKEGAVIVGAVSVLGGIEVVGTVANPVTWDLGVYGEPLRYLFIKTGLKAANIRIKNGSVEYHADDPTGGAALHGVTFDDVTLKLSGQESGNLVLNTTITKASFNRSTLGLLCGYFDLITQTDSLSRGRSNAPIEDGSLGTQLPEPGPALPSFEFKVWVEQTTFTGSQIKMLCPDSYGSQRIDMTLKSSNIFALDPPSLYFLDSNDWNASANTLVHFDDVFFANEGQIVDGNSEFSPMIGGRNLLDAPVKLN